MPIRSLAEQTGSRYEVGRGNGTGVRTLTAVDSMGFTVCHTVVRAGLSLDVVLGTGGGGPGLRLGAGPRGRGACFSTPVPANRSSSSRWAGTA
ncbi:cupin domain-containing protein [Streptomyces prasinus]